MSDFMIFQEKFKKFKKFLEFSLIVDWAAPAGRIASMTVGECAQLPLLVRVPRSGDLGPSGNGHFLIFKNSRNFLNS